MSTTSPERQPDQQPDVEQPDSQPGQPQTDQPAPGSEPQPADGPRSA